MILLIGATGVIGTHVASALAGRSDVRALAHSDASARELERLSIGEVTRGDLADPASLEPALRGGERLFIVTPFTPDQAELEINAIEAAERAGVKHLVKISVSGAEQPDPLAFGRTRQQAERRLAQTTLTSTILRPTNYMTNLFTQASAEELASGGLDAG